MKINNTWDMTYTIVLPESEYLDELMEMFDWQWYPKKHNIMLELLDIATAICVGVHLLPDLVLTTHNNDFGASGKV